MAKRTKSENFAYLIGGKITAVEEEPDEEMGGHTPLVTMTITFPTERTVTDYGKTIDDVKSVELQCWADEEGNGPGELVLVSCLVREPA